MGYRQAFPGLRRAMRRRSVFPAGQNIELLPFSVCCDEFQSYRHYRRLFGRSTLALARGAQRIKGDVDFKNAVVHGEKKMNRSVRSVLEARVFRGILPTTPPATGRVAGAPVPVDHCQKQIREPRKQIDALLRLRGRTIIRFAAGQGRSTALCPARQGRQAMAGVSANLRSVKLMRRVLETEGRG